jgi:chromosome segregation ATPase
MRGEGKDRPAELGAEVERQRALIETLETELKVRSRWDEDLRLTAENLDARLLGRDREITKLRGIQQALLEELEWRRKNEESLRETEERLGHDIQHLQQQLATIEQTRLWRLGRSYWRFKERLRGALPRQTR